MATFVAKTAARKLFGKKLQDKFGPGVSISGSDDRPSFFFLTVLIKVSIIYLTDRAGSLLRASPRREVKRQADGQGRQAETRAASGFVGARCEDLDESSEESTSLGLVFIHNLRCGIWLEHSYRYCTRVRNLRCKIS